MPPKPTLYAATVATPGTAAQPVAPAAAECKPKKTLSEETKAKLAASRQRKKEEKEAAAAEEARLVKEEFDRIEAEQAAAAQKKEAAAAKRREARLKRKTGGAATTNDPSPESSPEPTPLAATAAKTTRKKRQKSVESDKPTNGTAEPSAAAGSASKHSIEGDTPPPWFTKYVTDMMKEKRDQEGAKVTKKEVKEEGIKTAAEKWQDKYTRARVRDAVDGHMGQMYSMIFA